MIVVGRETIDKAAKKHPELRRTLTAWLARTEDAETEQITWTNRLDVEQNHPSVDFHGRHKRYIFNLSYGYRLIANITFVVRTVRVDHIFTHEEYMEWSNS